MNIIIICTQGNVMIQPSCCIPFFFFSVGLYIPMICCWLNSKQALVFIPMLDREVHAFDVMSECLQCDFLLSTGNPVLNKTK